MSNTIGRSPNMPPVKPQPEAGTQTSDRYGHVISTRPAPAPFEPPKQAPAPTSDRWGNIVSVPPGYVAPQPLPPGAVGSESSDGAVEWK